MDAGCFKIAGTSPKPAEYSWDQSLTGTNCFSKILYSWDQSLTGTNCCTLFTALALRQSGDGPIYCTHYIHNLIVFINHTFILQLSSCRPATRPPRPAAAGVVLCLGPLYHKVNTCTYISTVFPQTVLAPEGFLPLLYVVAATSPLD
jgi:hypothetical protein